MAQFDDLLLHSATKAALEQFVARPSHAAIIKGEPGAGTYTLAQRLTAELLAIEPIKLASQPYFKVITSPAQKITIDQIRELQDFLKLKTIGAENIKRAVIVRRAHTMTTEAQNAFLKLLEEPPADTVLFLTVAGEHVLLPTVYSRAQTISVISPSLEEAVHHFNRHGIEQNDIVRAYHMSGGNAGLLAALLSNSNEHELAVHIHTVKELLKMSRFDRLCSVDELSKQKDATGPMLQAFMRVSQAALHQAAEKGQTTEISRWTRTLRAIYNAQIAFTKGANAKLLYTNLLISL